MQDLKGGENIEKDINEKNLMGSENMPYRWIAKGINQPQYKVKQSFVVIGIVLIIWGLLDFSRSDILKVAPLIIGIYLFFRGL